MSMLAAPSKLELLEALRTCGEQALRTLRAVPESSLARGRYEGGWTGREIVAHLASVEWTYPRLIDLARQSAARAGARAGSTAAPSGGIDAYNARQVARRAETPVAELLAEFKRNREATIAAVEETDDALLAIPVQTAAGLSGPLGAVLRFVAVDHVLGHVEDVTADA
jgi:Mycothiol maleylpyruvate isomerase N-terminal domain